MADALSRKEDTDLKTKVERETAQLQAQTRGTYVLFLFHLLLG